MRMVDLLIALAIQGQAEIVRLVSPRLAIRVVDETAWDVRRHGGWSLAQRPPKAARLNSGRARKSPKIVVETMLILARSVKPAGNHSNWRGYISFC